MPGFLPGPSATRAHQVDVCAHHALHQQVADQARVAVCQRAAGPQDQVAVQARIPATASIALVTPQANNAFFFPGMQCFTPRRNQSGWLNVAERLDASRQAALSGYKEGHGLDTCMQERENFLQPWQRQGTRRAATAVARAWLDWMPPRVTTVSAPCRSASATRNSSLRTCRCSRHPCIRAAVCEFK